MAEATKPIIDRISDSVPSASDVTGAAKGFSEGVTQSIASAREGISRGLEDFSKSADISDASSDFLSANGLLAKFVFLILVLIAFMILMKVGIAVLGYMLGPWSNPYLIKGSLGGSTTATITQDPRDDDSAIIMRSNDRNKGIEFTWSLWLFLDKDSNGGIKNIFVKGDEQFSGDYNLLNGPGLYLDSTGNTFDLQVRMDTVNSHVDSVIKDVPIQKWFHVAIRMQNKVMDTYINGVVTDRFNLPSLPKQNFNNVTVHANGGYSGSTSNLRYYSYALNVFEINNIIMFGPNLNPSNLSADSKALSGNYSFLAHSWYGSNYST
jgi:hypothetical protein